MASLDLPEKAMRQQVASAISVVIQTARLSDGTRKITQIAEIIGMEGDVVTMQDIFIFEREGIAEGDKVLGRFRATGIRPRFADRFKACGINLGAGIFETAGGAPPPGPPLDHAELPTLLVAGLDLPGGGAGNDRPRPPAGVASRSGSGRARWSSSCTSSASRRSRRNDDGCSGHPRRWPARWLEREFADPRQCPRIGAGFSAKPA